MSNEAWRAAAAARRRAAASRPLPTALGAIAICVLLLMVWRLLAGSSSSSSYAGSSGVAYHLAGAGAAAAAPPGVYSSPYEAAAAANLTRWRNRLLADVLPTFSQRYNGSTLGFSAGDWDLFPPAISCPPERPLKRYGPGTDDGTKLLCSLDAGRLQQPCVIYSMGSAGNYLFEDAMLAATPCEIHTFDCTVDGVSRDPLRHRFWKVCIGNPGTGLATGRDFRSWDQVTRELKHTRVSLLKIDIEGHEYPVLASLAAGGGSVLPDEISMEIHARYVAGWARTHLEGSWQNGVALPVTQGDLALVFLHLANQGYGVYSSEPNVDWSMCCSEFSLLRIPGAALTAAQLAGGGGGGNGGGGGSQAGTAAAAAGGGTRRLTRWRWSG